MNGPAPPAPDEGIEPDDAPELTDEFFARADEYVGDTLVRRGRPPPPADEEAPK